MNKAGSLFIATIVALLVSSTILSGGIHISEAKKSSLEELRAQQQQRQQQQREQQQQNLQTQATTTQAATTSGTSGASNLADNSVTSPKIKDGEVRTNDLANSAVTTDKIKDGTIKKQDVNPTDWASLKGDKGDPGSAVKLVSISRTVEGEIPPNSFGVVTVDCEPNEVVTGGGFIVGIDDNPVLDSTQFGNGWHYQEHNVRSVTSAPKVFATCTHLEPIP